MKMLRFIICILNLLAFTSQAQELCVFDQNNYEGWQYNRSDVELNRDNISHQRIRLFKNSQGEDCTLDSPIFDCTGVDSISVDVDYDIMIDDFIASKLDLSAIIKDIDGHELSSSIAKVQGKDILQTLNFRIKSPAKKSIYFTFAAFKADKYNNAAVRKIVIKSIQTAKPGDVNNDGVIDIIDVNCVISFILGAKTQYNCDVNVDGNVDVVDVNMIISKILNSQ